MTTNPPELVAEPRNPYEAATRYAVLISFAGQHIPSISELAKWSGCTEAVVLRELKRWHPMLHDLLTNKSH